LKVSIITATYNCKRTILKCLESFTEQSYNDLEHVIIDGASTDGTLKILQEHRSRGSVLISEPDCGIYDALNKGFALATGDIVGILHSDDVFYEPSILADISIAFEDPLVDYVYGDIEMVNSSGKVVRCWKTGKLKDGRITGSQIPHPALFLSRNLLQRLDPVFDTSYRISADLKQQLIFANILQANGVYLARPLVRMLIGGTSTANFFSYLLGWRESRRAWNEVFGSGGSLYVMKKVLSKISGIRF